MMEKQKALVHYRLPRDFFSHSDVVGISRQLIGHSLITCFNGELTGGVITETEAYRGPEDRASHAWNNRRTARTEDMFHRGGTAYVYLCYGIHHLFNVVTGEEGVPHAVLIRAIKPTFGTGMMLSRRSHAKMTKKLCAGPGTLAQALGIKTLHSGIDICDVDSPIWISESKEPYPREAISCGPRIGIDYAGEWAHKPWRFFLLPSR